MESRSIWDIVCRLTGEPIEHFALYPFVICLPNEGLPVRYLSENGTPCEVPASHLNRTMAAAEAPRYLHTAYVEGVSTPHFIAWTENFVVEYRYGRDNGLVGPRCLPRHPFPPDA